jgi:lysozyme family protein
LEQISNFDRAFEETLEYEGGYVNDPDDPGGETKFGISKRQYPDLDIPNLTLEQAKEIYYRDYWQALLLDYFNGSRAGERVAREIFDTAVNLGVRGAAYIAQRAVNFLSQGDLRGEKITEDGMMGPITLAAIGNWCIRDAEALFKVLNGFQFMYYHRVIIRDPAKGKYAHGWMRRIQGWKGE